MPTTEPLPTIADRLISHADNILSPAMHQLETDLRLAAAMLKELDAPMAPVEHLVDELRRMTVAAPDAATRGALRVLLGNLA
jgi:hypothetical protein